MDDDIQDQDDSLIPVIRGRRLPAGRSAYIPITTSPFKDEIDRQLFADSRAIPQIYAWLISEGVDDISQSMLYRYKRDVENRAIPSVVVETSQAEIHRNWTGLGKIIDSGLKAVDNGVVPRPQEVLAAIKEQNQMLIKLGIGVNVQVVQKSRDMMRKLVTEIILPNVSEEQRTIILEAILADEELQEWAVEE